MTESSTDGPCHQPRNWVKLESISGAPMSRSATVHVLDQTTGERVIPADVMLYRIGVAGETRAESAENGSFLFTELPEGEYSLAVYDPQYAPHYERFVVTGEGSKILEVYLIAAGFLSGQVLDEEGHPPERCYFTLLRPGERRGKSGYINASGDHEVSKDGTFRSPPLGPARYFLRVAGFLRKPAVTNPTEEPGSILKRNFDFLYPNAWDLADATGFDIAAGDVISGLQVRTQRPIRYTVRGRVIGDLPEQPARISVMFAREVGALDHVGGAAAAVQASGTFECATLPGRYSLEVCEFSPPEPNGRTHLLRRWGKATINVAEADLDGVEIQVSSEDPAL